MQLLELNIWRDRKDKNNSDLTDPDRQFNKYNWASFEVTDETANELDQYLLTQGFKYAEGWASTDMLYHKEWDVLIELSFSELDEPSPESKEDILRRIKPCLSLTE